jgi:hypothetical protein
MLGSQMNILEAVLGFINNAIITHQVDGVQIIQVNILMPDGRATTLSWDSQAKENPDGTFTGDWVITNTETRVANPAPPTVPPADVPVP